MAIAITKLITGATALAHDRGALKGYPVQYRNNTQAQACVDRLRTLEILAHVYTVGRCRFIVIEQNERELEHGRQGIGQ
jgi:hypothetical protein